MISMEKIDQNSFWREWAEGLTPETVDCVAIKVVHPYHADTVASEQAVHRQLNELGDPPPQIAKLLDSFVADGHPCLVSEMFGQELGAFMNEWELDVKEVRQSASDLLLGIQALHRKGIVHTDIKPQNVLYCARTGQAKLIDFSTASTDCVQGRVYGTRLYRPPEYLLGLPWGPPVDIWSAACAIYEMVTGTPLFNAYEKVKEVRRWLWAPARWRYDAFKHARAQAKGTNSASSASEESSGTTKRTFARRQVLDGRYILVSELGSGHFSTVWKAVRLPEHLKVESEQSETRLSDEPRTLSASEEASSSSLDCPYGWKRLYDRCIAFAHFLTIQECLGHFPVKIAKEGFYYRAYYTRRKRLKFNPRLQSRTIRERLLEDHHFAESDAEQFADFLTPMLAFDASHRASIDDCLAHPWLASR